MVLKGTYFTKEELDSLAIKSVGIWIPDNESPLHITLVYESGFTTNMIVDEARLTDMLSIQKPLDTVIYN